MKFTGSLWPDPRNYSPKRLFCLDLLRGIDMFYLAVFAPFLNWRLLRLQDPGCPQWMQVMFNHPWTAFAPTATGFGLFDFGQPLFLFVCGAAVPLALPKRMTPDGRPTAAFWTHVLKRLALLTFFACLNRGLLEFDWGKCFPQSDTMLVIAAGYLFAALLLLVRNRTARLAIPFAVVAGLWILQQTCGDYTVTGNANYRFDAVFGSLGAATKSYAYGRKFPFLLTTLGFGALSMFGMLSMELLLSKRAAWTKARGLAAAGVALFAVGWVTSLWIPPIRQIYTLSFVLMTTGLSVLCLDALYVITDIFAWRRGTGLFLLLGMFSLFTWEIANFCYPAVQALAEKLVVGVPHLLGGGDRCRSIAVGVAEMAVVVALAICRYRMKRH